MTHGFDVLALDSKITQTLDLLYAGEAVRAGSYILGSVALCLLAVWAGVVLGRT